MTGTKRSALGEVTNGGKDQAAKGLKAKGKAVIPPAREKRALQQTSSIQLPAATTTTVGPARRTRSSVASTATATISAPSTIIDDKPAVKRRTVSRIPVASRSRSNTASTSTTAAETRLRERKINVALETKIQLEHEAEPARKKLKTSSPALEEVDDKDDLADEGLYDEDGKEVVFSSGGRGTRCKSPPRTFRAKDYGWTDLDAEDDGDPTMASEYVVDAFNYMMSIEVSSDQAG